MRCTGSRTLQLDLPLLIERPELVLPCLYRRCKWLGDIVFYPGRGPVPVESDSVAALLDEWVDRPMRWLRALRPPRFPLDAGVVEEYRIALEGDIRFSGELIGVVGKDAAVGWERSTGRKIDVRDRLHAPVVTWTHEWEQGRISLRSKDRQLDIAIDASERVFGSFDLGNDLVLVRSWFEPDPYDDLHAYVLYLIDVSAGRILWRVDGECRAVIQIGETLHTLGDGIVQRSLATGAQLADQPFRAHAAVFAPDGRHIATRDDCVIRVWDLEQLSPKIVACRAGGAPSRASTPTARLMIAETKNARSVVTERLVFSIFRGRCRD